ncbi:Enoyl-CoA hydratase/isomerase [Sphingopyxis sp. LC81]|uniref:crotonase/enoyl-CoA hydratase family protein n=1 Tax=Sphingopyxis sp. LC81 TaxID=1502850 RepID=UPI00050D9FFE|nr:crotonase/enoyl-CoA hydratase family protein [Sphingopyxis sp. LC81]KGB53610.1 Enoyl-CoA hydratase/isomerase [Sphingopyxis sp. LC81]
MQQAVQYELNDSIAVITIDDGKRNAMGPAVLRSLAAAVALAEADAAAMIIRGRDGVFSVGFDLQVFARSNPDEIHEMVHLGAELALSLFTSPIPLVTACTGHAYPMGAFLLLASDLVVAADGPYQIGLNEVAIGLTLPGFAVELARATLSPPYFQRVITGEMLAPSEASRAGYIDHVVAAGELEGAVRAAADALIRVDVAAYRATKTKVRGEAAARIRAAIDEEITVEKYRMRARR